MKDIYFADFETTSDTNPHFNKEKGQIVYLGYISNYNFKSNGYFYNIDTFFKFVINNNIKLCLFHNLSFDGDFIIKSLISDYDYVMINNPPQRSDKFKCIYTIKASASDYLTISYRWTDGLKWETCNLMCSMKKTHISVANIGKLIDTSKLDIDHDTINYNYNSIINNKKAHEYVKRDVDNVINYFHSLEIEPAFYKQYFKMMTAGQAIWKRITNLDNKITRSNNEVSKIKLPYSEYETFRPLFYGGFTQFNKKYYNQILTGLNGAVFDVNSMYPYFMLQPLAYVQIYDIDGLKPDEYIEAYSIIIISSKNNTNWNTLRYSGKRYISEINEPTIFFYFKPEWDILCKFNTINYNIVKTFYFKVSIIKTLNSVVSNLLLQRQKLKDLIAGGNISLRAVESKVKVETNGIYGKNCQRPLRYMDLFFKESVAIGDVVTVYNRNKPYTYKIIIKRTDDSDFGEFKCYVGIPLDEPIYARNIILGSHITSLGRTMLLNVIYNNLDNVIKCDTDSVFFLDRINANYFGMNIHNKNIGSWKMESEFNEILVNRAKGYEYWNKDKRVIKCNGVNNEIMQGLPKWFMYQDGKDIIIKNGKLAAKRTKTGIQLRKVDIHIKDLGNE